MKVLFFIDRNGKWRWNVRARNNKRIATSGENFDSKGNAKRAAKAFVRNLINAHSKNTLVYVDVLVQVDL